MSYLRHFARSQEIDLVERIGRIVEKLQTQDKESEEYPHLYSLLEEALDSYKQVRLSQRKGNQFLPSKPQCIYYFCQEK